MTRTGNERLKKTGHVYTYHYLNMEEIETAIVAYKLQKMEQ